MKHKGECATDPIAEDVCEGLHREKTNKILGLRETLKAVRTLVGEDKVLAKIIDDGLKEYDL